MYSRREIGKFMLAALCASRRATPNPASTGIVIGVHSYSFRDRPLDAAIQAMVQLGFRCCELYDGHIQPPNPTREQLRSWREAVRPEQFEDVRRKFQDAGIELYALNYSFRGDDVSDKEIARGFEIANVLHVKRITASSNISTAKRVIPFARKAKIPVGWHNYSDMGEDKFARPSDFEQALAWDPTYSWVTLDIGHFVASGFDPVAFIEKHHERIMTIHVKDRSKNFGPNRPLGQGDTPIREVLNLLKKNGYGIPAIIEYEYKGGDTIEEVRKSYDYCRSLVSG